MARSDYAHWNEEADIVWWQEEGRHAGNEEPVYEDELYDVPDDDWEDFDDEDEPEAIEPESWYAEDLDWAGLTE